MFELSRYSLFITNSYFMMIFNDFLLILQSGRIFLFCQSCLCTFSFYKYVSFNYNKMFLNVKKNRVCLE